MNRIVGETSRLDLPRIAFGWKLGSAFRSFGPLNVLNGLLAPFWETVALRVKLRGNASFCFRAYPRWLNIAGAAMTGF